MFQEESQTIRDERKDHGAVDESSSEQQIRESANYTLIVRKNWSPRPSATGCYGRQAGRQNHLSARFFKNSLESKLEALGLFERRYSVLSRITSVVVGFLCSDFYNVVCL